MKPNKFVPQAVVALKFPPLSRTVITSKRKKFLFHHCYGTSSKPAGNLNTSKISFFNVVKATSDNITPIIWKTVAIASSLLNNASFYISKSEKNNDKETDKETLIPSSVQSNPSSTSDVSNHSDLKVGSKSLSSSSEKREASLNEQKDFLEWLAGGDLQAKRKEFLQKDTKDTEKSKKVVISKSSLEHRSRFLAHSIAESSSCASQLLRLDEINKHLLLYPQQKTIMCKTGLVKTVLRLKQKSSDYAVEAQARNTLSLIGFHDRPQGQGIRILSIDGGGTRGLIAIEVLRQLEARTKRKVHELFDFMCGVSSGAILCVLLGGLRISLDECETLYRKLSDEVFSQSTFWGTGRLVWNHAYYDTTTWVNVLKKTFGEKLLSDTAKDEVSPKLAVISAVMNLSYLRAFVFRNYDFPPRVHSYYLGSCKYKMWEAIRASGAAPGYFEECWLDDYLHQDGGIMINNPSSLAIHEAQLLWPSDHIQCVLSLGSGRFIPAVQPNFTSTNLKTKVLKVIDSATDTEAVHIGLNNLLSPNTYFRINPYLTEFLALDENRPEKLDQMKMDAQMYLRRNEFKFSKAARALCQQRSYAKSINDWLQIQRALYI